MQSSEIGDCIRMEVSADLKSQVDAPPYRKNSRRSRWLDSANKEYPPPLSCLARMENLQPHMPWVMKKYYTEDGRLIIREEKVKHHEYFLADRSNGRLVLNLVHLDDAVEENCKECHAVEEDSEINQFPIEEIDGGDEGIGNPMGEEVSPECYKYNGYMGVKPCGGFVASPAAVFRPPVHI